jgi:large subunit ribosomal protein L21e
MAMRVGGNRRKTRHILQSDVRSKGKISIARYLQPFQVGDHVLLKAQPAVHEGLYFRRYHGMRGCISGKQGHCYLVDIDAKGKTKSLIVHPAHLVKQL